MFLKTKRNRDASNRFFSSTALGSCLRKYLSNLAIFPGMSNLDVHNVAKSSQEDHRKGALCSWQNSDFKRKYLSPCQKRVEWKITDQVLKNKTLNVTLNGTFRSWHFLGSGNQPLPGLPCPSPHLWLILSSDLHFNLVPARLSSVFLPSSEAFSCLCFPDLTLLAWFLDLGYSLTSHCSDSPLFRNPNTSSQTLARHDLPFSASNWLVLEV